MNWDRMTDEQRRVTLHAMYRYGGRFASRLADAWSTADAPNAERLGAAFPELVERYGPGTDAYAGAARIEAA